MTALTIQPNKIVLSEVKYTKLYKAILQKKTE